MRVAPRGCDALGAERPSVQVRRPLAVDLFSGTGGATKAFSDAGWSVLSFDLLRAGRPTAVADVRRLPLPADGSLTVDFLWASPPCTEFSTAAPGREDRRPSLELIFASLAAVRDLRPRFWILENVRGAIPFLGTPVQKIGPWCLWGYFPLLDVNLRMHDHRKFDYDTARDRAAVPIEVSRAALVAIERHQELASILDLRPFRRHRHVKAHQTSGGPDLFTAERPIGRKR